MRKCSRPLPGLRFPPALSEERQWEKSEPCRRYSTRAMPTATSRGWGAGAAVCRRRSSRMPPPPAGERPLEVGCGSLVHGIADQPAGQTPREVARLLCHGEEGGSRDVQGEIHDVLVPVRPLDPSDRWTSGPARRCSCFGRLHRGPHRGFREQLGRVDEIHLVGELAQEQRDLGAAEDHPVDGPGPEGSRPPVGPPRPTPRRRGPPSVAGWPSRARPVIRGPGSRTRSRAGPAGGCRAPGRRAPVRRRGSTFGAAPRSGWRRSC
jgi:hypothetical protein